MFHRLRPRQHRRAGHAGIVQAREPLLRGAGEQGGLHQVQALVRVAVSAARRSETLVFQQIRAFGGAAEALPLIVRHRRYGDVAGLRFIHEVDDGGGALRLDLPIQIGPGTHVRRPHEGHHGVQHGKPDVLRLAGALAGEKGARHGLRGGDAGQLVRQDGANQARARFVGAPLHAGQAGKRLDQRVVNRLVGVRAGLPKAAHGNVDDVFLGGADVRFVQPQASHHAGAVVLHEHIRGPRQAQQHFAPRRRSRVHAQRALVAVVVQEHRIELLGAGAAAAREIPAAGALHLDHVGALVAKDHRTVRAGDDAGEVDDANAV